jgi:hypothetical protein
VCAAWSAPSLAGAEIVNRNAGAVAAVPCERAQNVQPKPNHKRASFWLGLRGLS